MYALVCIEHLVITLSMAPCGEIHLSGLMKTNHKAFRSMPLNGKCCQAVITAEEFFLCTMLGGQYDISPILNTNAMFFIPLESL
jgi:hypothetical protein